MLIRKNAESRAELILPSFPVVRCAEPFDLPRLALNTSKESPGPKDDTQFDAVLWRKAKLTTEQADFINKLAAGESPAQLIVETKLKPSEQRDALLLAKCIILGRRQNYPPQFEKAEQHALYRTLSAAEIHVEIDPVVNSQSKTRERKDGFPPSEALFNYSEKLPQQIRIFETRATMVRNFKPHLSGFVARIDRMAKDDPKEAERILRAEAPILFQSAYFTERLKPVDGFVPSILHLEALQLRGEQLAQFGKEPPKEPEKTSTPEIRQITPYDLRIMPYAMWCRPAVDIMNHSYKINKLGLPAAKEFSCELSKLAIERYADRMNDPRGVDGFRYSFYSTFEAQEIWKHRGAADAYYNNRHKILGSETESRRSVASGALCEELDLRLCHKIYNARRDQLEAEGRIPVFPRSKK